MIFSTREKKVKSDTEANILREEEIIRKEKALQFYLETKKLK